MKAKEIIIKTWYQAQSNRNIQKGCIFHSDRGVQYACHEFRNILKNNAKITQSMSRKGNCWDNAVAESFFKSIKYEFLNHYKFNTKDKLEKAVNNYINWYNTERIHSALDYKTPLEKYAELNNYLIKIVA